MKILHTEGSTGWGGQEIRILKEASGLRARGHEIFFAIEPGGKLIDRARAAGFIVLEVSFKKRKCFQSLFRLLRFIKEHRIEIINTHSSSDAWIGGLAGRLASCRIVRTRHLSTPSKGGINSLLLYRGLADFVVTTSQAIIPAICKKANLSLARCSCVATGVDPGEIIFEKDAPTVFRRKYQIPKESFLIGTVCMVRSWKGIQDFIAAAEMLSTRKDIHWVIVGGGYVDAYKEAVVQKKIDDIVHFTGHLESPFGALAAFDAFTLLSTAHEGVSQATLQAAFLKKPLITTSVGGLPEVCFHEKTGLIVPSHNPQEIVKAVLRLVENVAFRERLGENAYSLCVEQFTITHTLDAMEKIFARGLDNG